ncbi:MAG TPA: hypothetical protein VFV38_15270 [Ktedonobacteraceae bacterium]|nr:hypothetical protein [Ktedonobacteraceae bacterium]
MFQAPFPPGRECSTSQASELEEKREPFRIISPEVQAALEQAPFFDALCAWLNCLAQAARANRETPQPPGAA